MHKTYKIDRYLKLALELRASDLHFSAAEPVRMRVDGDLVPVEEMALSSEAVEEIMMELLTAEERQKFTNHRNIDKSYSIPGTGNFRVNIFQMRRGIAAVLRTIPHKIPTMQDLGLPPQLAKLTDVGKGLILVTGPTGSGKSTTLASLINYINVNNAYHILTAEDPIEFVHQSQKSLVNQREIGSQCPTFSDALKYALREDPDVILVGEMRDLETISLALTAAETGHLVFGTLHTRGAGASVDRIIDSFPANQQAMIRTMLSESLSAVISQSLLKKADGKGRVAAYEILVVNHAISNLIREGKTFQIPSIMQTGRKEGMILMDQYIIDLVVKGTVTFEEASAYMLNPELLAPHKRRKQTSGTSATPASPVVEEVPAKPALKSVSKEPIAPVPTPAPAPVASSAVAKPTPKPQAPAQVPRPNPLKSVSKPAPVPAPAPAPIEEPIDEPVEAAPEEPMEEVSSMQPLSIEGSDGISDPANELQTEFSETEPTDITGLDQLMNSDPDETLLQERRAEEDSRETMIMELPPKTTPPPAKPAPEKSVKAPLPPPPFPKRKIG